MKAKLLVWAMLGASALVAVLSQYVPFAWALGVMAGVGLPLAYLPERDAKRDAQRASNNL